MTTSIPLGELESSAAAKFDHFGDAYSGRITAIDQRPQTDMNTGAPRYFASGAPMMLWVLTIEQANGDSVALWARGGKFKAAEGSGESMLSAIGTAVRNAGAGAVEVGAELAVAYTGRGEGSPGKNPAKLYTAQYRAATTAVPVSLFSDEG